MAGLGSSAIFAGIGALQGAGDAMQYQNHLRDAIDVAHQQLWDKTNAEQTLNKAKADDDARAKAAEANATKYQTRHNDPVILKTLQGTGAEDPNAPDLSGSQPQLPWQGKTGNQQVPQGTNQPGMMQPAPQDQSQAPQSQGIQPRTQALAQNNTGTPALPQELALNNSDQNPQGRSQPTPTQAPEPPPPQSKIPPNAPASILAGQHDNINTLQTKDPYDLVGNDQGWVKNAQTGQYGWVQERHDLVMDTHHLYPNLSPEAINAAVNDYMPKTGAMGNWDSRQAWSEHLGKLDGQAAKYEGGPVAVDKLPEASKEYMIANRNLGLSNTDSLQPLRPSEEIQNAKVFTQAQQAKQASESGINTMNSLFSSMGVNNMYGPFAKTSAQIQTALASMSDTEVSKTVDNWWVQNKDQIQASNAMIKSLPGGSRAGIGLLNRESEGVPSATMSPDAERQMILQYYSSFRQSANYSDALMSGPARYVPMEDRIAHANEYAKQNPAIGVDGVTPNPNFKEYNDWLSDTAKGVKSSGPTESDIRKQGLDNIQKNSPMKSEEKNFDYSKIEAGQQYTAPDGSIRIKGGKK